MRKILGVIGGMGPQATSFFYEELVAHTKASSDQEHIDTVILGHASMPDRTKAILTGEEEPVLAAMEKDVRLLEAAGAANIVIPCNTAHYFYDPVQAMTQIPVIHMVRETVREAVTSCRKALSGSAFSSENPSCGNHSSRKVKIGVMATDGTIRAGVYAKECAGFGENGEAGCELITPSPQEQKAVMSLIYDEVKAGKTPDPGKFEMAYRALKEKGADCVILACTELSVYRKYHPVPEDCLDALEILVRESVIRSGGTYV